MKRTLLALAGTIGLAACTGPVPTITEVGPSGVPAGTRVVPYDINNDGTVIVSVNSTTGVLREDGELRQYPLPAGYTSCVPAKGANDGLIVGRCSGQPSTPGLDSAGFAVYWDASGTVREIDTKGLKPTYAVDVNEQGIILGYAAPGTSRTPWIFDLRSSQFTTLPLPPGAATALANAINDLGDIVGTASFAGESGERAILWSRETLAPRTLDDLSSASGINNDGVIIGGDSVLTSPDSRPSALPKPVPRLGEVNLGCTTKAINDEGRIIGRCSTGAVGSDFGRIQGVIWSERRAATVLEDALLPVAINASGRVVATSGSLSAGSSVYLIDF